MHCSGSCHNDSCNRNSCSMCSNDESSYRPCVPILPPGCNPPDCSPHDRFCISYSHVSGRLEEFPCKYTHLLGIRNLNKIWKINNPSFKNSHCS